jgi:hypothetical protein
MGIVVRNGSSRVAMIDDSIDEIARQMTNAEDGSRVPNPSSTRRRPKSGYADFTGKAMSS